MKTIIRQLLITGCILLPVQVFSQMTILSGPEKGSYNQFVNDIVKVLGEKDGIKLLNRQTKGSAFNFKELTNPSSGVKIGLIQSDYLSLMEAEDKLNSTNKTGSLKVVMDLANEEIHVVTRKSSGLRILQDLANKKVGIGSEDQGSLATAKLMRERSKVSWTSYYVNFDQMLKQLKGGIIDAFLVVGSAPLDMLDIDPRVMVDGGTLIELDDFNGWAQYYDQDTIYRKDYRWLEKDVPTFGVRTLLVVNESKLTGNEKQTVSNIRKAIIKELPVLKKEGHPKWKEVIIPDDDIDMAGQEAAQPKPAGNTSETKENILYRVQIYSRNYEKEGVEVSIGGKSYKTYVYLHLDAYRYTIGEFTTFSAAVELQNICRKAGYPEAFVAAFRNNKRDLSPDLFK